MSGIAIKPLDGVGAEISGIDLCEDISPADMASLRAALAENGVIFFHDQEIDEQDHIAFAKRWGKININRFFAAHENYPEIALVAKEPDQKQNIGGGWHTDHSYDREPAMGSILVARETPETGGDTMFASMYRAFETLDDDLRKEIKDKRAVHSAKHIFGKNAYYEQQDDFSSRIGNSETGTELNDVSHPMVINHPDSGKKAVYVNPAFTIKVEGLEEEESNKLLSKIYTHCMNTDHVHRFKWKPGSIAFWDNRSTWHWALNDYHGQRRVMHRITVEGSALE